MQEMVGSRAVSEAESSAGSIAESGIELIAETAGETRVKTAGFWRFKVRQNHFPNEPATACVHLQ